uniref:Uncharacterized protein n=1 Tax=Tanacetum cinerariifolium TaxID=118510 RepID=A0A6L2KH87_TANCI|nr:hypothetical protein [Tanacetum cinerariifolium]
MQEFWATVFVHKSSIKFTINKKKVSLDVDTFREILQICPNILGQRFEDLLLEHKMLSFIRDLGHTRDIHYLTDVSIDYLHQPWRAFSTIINKCLSGKDTTYEKIRLSRAQILWVKLESEAYKTYYAYASGEKTPKPKYVRKKADLDTSPKKKPAQATKGTRLKSSANMAKYDKKKQPAKMPKTKGLAVLSKVALTEAEQLKLATKRSNTQLHSSHVCGSGDGVDTQSKSDEESWTFSQDKEDANEEMDLNDDSEETESDNDGDDLTHPNLSTYKADDEEEEEKTDDEEMSFDQRVSTPPKYKLTDEEENKEGDDKDKEGKQVQDEEDDLYRDVNINLERSDAKMTDAQANQDTEDSDMTLTLVPLVVQQQSSSVSSDLVSKFINPSSNTCIDLILNLNIQSHTLVNVLVCVAAETPSSDTTIPQPPILNIQPLQQTLGSITTTTIPTMTFPEIPNFASLFQFDQRMKEAIDVAVQLQTNKLREEAQAENQEFLNQRGRDDQDKDEDPFARSNQGSKRRRLGKEAETSKEPTHKESKSTVLQKVHPNLNQNPRASLLMQKSMIKWMMIWKINHIKSSTQEIMMMNVSGIHLVLQLLIVNGTKQRLLKTDHLNHGLHKWLKLQALNLRLMSFLATPIDFFTLIMHRIKINNMTQEVLTGPTYDLIKGMGKSVVELKYHLEEVFKATNDRLHWHNPEGKPYPYDLTKLLPLVLKEQGRQVIPLDHFINNNLEYLKGESSSQKYTTSITKTKAADYGQVKWIEDKGLKHQKIYGYASNMESKHDVYSRHKIIAVTSLKIMKWFGYSHLEEIIVRRQDDQLYKFREGDFKRLQRYALNVALRMFTRCIVIQERVKDLQLGVESYRKKINLERPYTYRSNLRRMTPYTANPDIQGIIYEDEMNRNCLIRTDELHKFSNGTLSHVRTALNDIAIGIEMDYLPKRKWSKQDKQRARVMINAIDKKLRDRRLMRNLEKFVGGRPYEGDLRLLERTI